jgi:hypothetical protein
MKFLKVYIAITFAILPFIAVGQGTTGIVGGTGTQATTYSRGYVATGTVSGAGAPVTAYEKRETVAQQERTRQERERQRERRRQEAKAQAQAKAQAARK